MFLAMNNMRFDVDISAWRVDVALDMERMFASCHVFNQPLREWQVGQVQTMEGMFKMCSAFGQDLSQWAVGTGTETKDMFSSSRPTRSTRRSTPRGANSVDVETIHATGGRGRNLVCVCKNDARSLHLFASDSANPLDDRGRFE
jgi:hypothetical protein